MFVSILFFVQVVRVFGIMRNRGVFEESFEFSFGIAHCSKTVLLELEKVIERKFITDPLTQYFSKLWQREFAFRSRPLLIIKLNIEIICKLGNRFRF